MATVIPFANTLLGANKLKAMKAEVVHLVSLLACAYLRASEFKKQKVCTRTAEIDTPQVMWIVTKLPEGTVVIEAWISFMPDRPKNHLMYIYRRDTNHQVHSKWLMPKDGINELMGPIDQVHSGLQALQDWFTSNSADMAYAVGNIAAAASYPIDIDRGYN